MATTTVTTAALLRRHAPLWKVTCRNPFIAGVRDGSLPVEVFDQWLLQHAQLADGLFPAYCRTTAAAPERDRPVLLGVLQTLAAYMTRLGRTLTSRGIDGGSPIHPVCRAYVAYTVSLGFEPYAVGLVAMWAQYRAYRDAWGWAHPGAPEFRAFFRDFYSPDYEGGLAVLGRATDSALAEASRPEVRRAEEAFLEVAKYELAFWVMTMSQSRET